MAAPDPADVARKIRQHDNELAAVYELLARVDVKVDVLGARVDGGFAAVDARFERVEDGQRQILELLRGLRRGDSDAG